MRHKAKPGEIQAALIENCVTRYGATVEQYKGITIVKYSNSAAKPSLLVFRGKNKKPYMYYYYRTEADRAAAEAGAKSEADRSQAYHDEKEKERLKNTETINTGDLFYTSWGYEQTNVEFYEVIEKPSEQFVIVREVAQNREETGFMSGSCTPQKGVFVGEPLRRKRGKWGLKISECQTAYKYDGGPKCYSYYG
jgi:hypothetical protein